MERLHRYLRMYHEGWQVLRNPQQEPEHIGSYYFREQMKDMVLYNNSVEGRLPHRALWYKFILVQQSIIFATMCYALTESLGSFQEMGPDLAFVIAYFFVLFKLFYFYCYADGVDQVIHDLETCRHWMREGPGSAEARSTRRFHFFLLIVHTIAWAILLGLLFVLLIISSLWVAQQNLPLHARYPLELHSKQHPITHGLCFVQQALGFLNLLTWITSMDGLSVFVYWDITCTIKVLCIELRHLSERSRGDEELLKRSIKRLVMRHQKILGIMERTNGVFQGTLMMQMMVNYVLISVSVFGALMARNDLKAAFHQGVLTLVVLGQLSMWSKFGDVLSQESLDIAQAAYEAYDPMGCDHVNRDLCFIIKAAQTPMQMRASPFPPYNMINYSATLNQCYSILTLLLKTLD